LAAATVLAVGGAGLAFEADHSDGPARSGHMMMEHANGFDPPREHGDRPHPRWEH